MILNDNRGVLLAPFQDYAQSPQTSFQASIMDAAGESLSFIGRINLESGSGSKTISSAGGGIYWSSGAITFANAGTTLRIGVQDVGATGIEDGTFDVNGDLVGGTDTISASSVVFTPMEAGTKTVNHGDVIAISIEMISRGGVDSVTANRTSTLLSSNFPYSTSDTGAGPVKTNSQPVAVVLFDDGTYGWLEGAGVYQLSNVSFGNTSTPDQRGLYFTLDSDVIISGVVFTIGSVAATDTFDVTLFGDPLGTPSTIKTVTVDPNLIASATVSNAYKLLFDSPVPIAKNTPYVIAIIPTSAGAVLLAQYDFGTGNSELRKATILGENWALATRTDAGAFTLTDTSLPQIGFNVLEFETGGGGGVSTFS